MSTPEAAAIGATRFHPASGELVGTAGTTRLAPQPSTLLGLLLANAGDVVTRDEIREHLWPHGKVEFDQGIAFAVREIRKAIEEVGGDPELLETIPKRGLRLHAASSSPTAGDNWTAPAAADQAAPAPPPPSRPTLRPPAAALAVLALFSIVALLALPRLTSRTRPVVAIFAHDARGASPAPEMASRLGAALTTSLTSTLDGLAGVIGPTGTSGLEGPDDTEGARSLLGACLLLSGSVESLEADSIVVFTQIVRASDRVHVWAKLDSLPTAAGLETLVRTIEGGVHASLADC
jgi:DNA-binding winged helix-turn-helix (wHTH) protein/TolB-like protein